MHRPLLGWAVIAFGVLVVGAVVGGVLYLRAMRGAGHLDTLAPSIGAADLELRSVGSRGDRLLVVVANAGTTDFGGRIMVAIDNGTPKRVDVGKPLRPGEALEAVLNDEYVQRRAQVSVSVSTPDATETVLDNNRLMAVVAPDQPIDLELESAAVDAASGHLVLGVRNHGPIPLVGTLTISVRESPPSNRLVTDADAPLDVGAGGLQRLELATPTRVDLTRVTVRISTDAISDTDSTNDVYPR